MGIAERTSDAGEPLTGRDRRAVSAAQQLIGRRPAGGDAFFKVLTLLAALSVPLLMVGILVELLRHSQLALQRFGWGFLTSDAWNPVTQEFGALSSIFGTVVSTAIALLIALPLGLVIALFLVEQATPRVAAFFGSAIELLAAVPSIIYGMWGLFVFAPFMATYVQPVLGEYLGFLPLFQGPPIGIGVLTAGIILAFMVLPYISSVTRDVFRMVPPVLKEAAYGVGATNWEVTRGVTIPYAPGAGSRSGRNHGGDLRHRQPSSSGGIAIRQRQFHRFDSGE